MKLELRKLELRDLTRSSRSSASRIRRPGRARCSPVSSRSRARSRSGRSNPSREALVGYLVISRYVDAWHVMNLAVTEPYRRRGVARTLLDQLFEVTAADERRGYTLEVRVSNEGAIKLYEAMGFVSRGVRRGYYTDNREDALIMWRDPVAAEHAEAG